MFVRMNSLFDLLFRNFSRAAVAFAFLSFPACADHAPDNLSQELDPDFISCMLAVDDASIQFISSLQSTCMHRILAVCGVGDAAITDGETVACLNFETRQAVDFLIKSANEFPIEIEAEGFCARASQRRLQTLRGDVGVLDLAEEPQDVEGAFQRITEAFVNFHIVLLTARETDTRIDGLSQYNGDHH